MFDTGSCQSGGSGCSTEVSDNPYRKRRRGLGREAWHLRMTLTYSDAQSPYAQFVAAPPYPPYPWTACGGGFAAVFDTMHGMRGHRSVGGDLSLNFPLFMAKLQ